MWPNRPGRTITWSNWSSDLGEHRNDGRGRDDLLAEGFTAAQLVLFRQQVAKWEAVLDVNFSEVSDSASNNVRIGINNTALSTTVAEVQPYVINNVTTIAQCLYYNETHMNEQYVLSGFTALHELGHVLGLGHCPNTANVMRAGFLALPMIVLQIGDKNGGRVTYMDLMKQSLTPTQFIF